MSSKPASSYSAAASELHRRLGFQTDRASVRRWALQNNQAPDTRYKKAPQPVKRWQVRDWGALWQYDASPHAWLPSSPDKQVLLDLIDDATRYNTGARLYPCGNPPLPLIFLISSPCSTKTHGLPLSLYVDYHFFFHTQNPDAFTQLGAALHFYCVKRLYAPTPQAKEKNQRRHDYWQKRNHALCRRTHYLNTPRQIMPRPTASSTPTNTKSIANSGTTPHAAHQQARADKRSVIRPAPQ